MKECRLTAEKKGDAVIFHSDNADLEDFGRICQALHHTIGLKLYRCGRTLDEVKDAMLDIHINAMEDLTKQVIKERSDAVG